MKSLLDGLLRADDLEGEIRAAMPAERMNTYDGIFGCGIHSMRGAELLRPFKFMGQNIHRDDLRRPHQARRLNDIQSHTATAEHGNRTARWDLGSVHHRPSAGCDATAHQTHHV